MRKWELYHITDTTLFKSYTHSHKETFMRTVQKNNLGISEYKGELEKLEDKVLNELVKDIARISMEEDNFLQEYNNINTKSYTKDEFLKSLNDTFFLQSDTLLAWGEVKSEIVRQSASTKKKEKVQEKIAVNNFQKQMEKIGKLYDRYIKEYTKLVNTVFKTDDPDLEHYKNSIERLKQYSENFKKAPKNREKLNILFREAIASTMSLGWTIEPLTASIINPIIQTRITGKELMNKGTVIDLMITLDSEDSPYGINVKSQKEKYTIPRSNFKSHYINDIENYESELNYIRRNLGALSLYNIDYPEGEDFKGSFLDLYNDFYGLESELAMLRSLISAIDGTREKGDWYSILISFQGGFLWTSDVLMLIYNDIINPRYGVFSYKTKGWNTPGNKTQLSTLWKNKKEVLKTKRSDDKDIYSQLNDIEPKIKHNTLIYMVYYTINLANAKNKIGGKK